MLEIILIVLVGLQLKKIAEAKGRPAKWALLALLIPAVGWTIGFVGGVIAGITTGETDLMVSGLFWPIAGIMYGAEILVGVAVYQYVKRLSPGPGAPVAGGVPAVGAAAPAAVGAVGSTQANTAAASQPGQAMAGLCNECGQNVWLQPDGSCPNGHPATSISGAYWALKG